MKKVVRDYLSFNKRERNGVFVLVSLIGAQLLYLNFADSFSEKKQMDLSGFEKQLFALQDSVAKEKEEVEVVDFEEASHTLQRKVRKPENKKIERFHFDPNNLPEEDWQRLGLSQKQIRIIKNFEAKGGKFRKKEDVKKIYGIKDEQYSLLEPYITIVSSNAVFENGEVIPLKTTKQNSIVELNTADSLQLLTVKGVGPFYAKNIIKYRNLLGGFVAKEQLMEIWKFDKEKYDAVEKFVRVDPTLAKKININTCDADQLKGAYLKWNTANGIVNYRKAHGKFKTIDEIKATDLVDEETYRKIAPYLVVE